DQGLTLLAPLVAIGAALATKRVIPSLAAGAAVGAMVAQEGVLVEAINAMGLYMMRATGFSFVGDTWAFNPDHVIISMFSLMVAATVGVMTASGGTRALVERLETIAHGPRGAMVTSWLAGMVVFFDDYANCLVVGNAMGPLCDQFRVSRAKLAYIVDSTAAPVASLAVISTWVGYEVGLLDDALVAAGSNAAAFSVFIHALPYRFYSIFTLFFVGVIAISNRDFGPMAVEELKARRGPLPIIDLKSANARGNLWLALLPVVVLVGLTFALMVFTGQRALGEEAATAPFFQVLGEAEAYWSMFMGSIAAFSLAAIMALSMRALSLRALILASWNSMGTVAEALIILYLAWTLGNAIGDTNAANFISGQLNGAVPIALIPAVTFLLAAFTAFSTGTSFGTMSILIPLVVPLSLSVSNGEVSHVVLGSTAAVLAGSCLGDHASPISDTTLLSALGANVDIIVHVRTQLPYAIAAGFVSLLVGYIPAGLGVTPWILIPIGCVGCLLVVLILGRKMDVILPTTKPEEATE
ncbi:MAG: Na+/H+ antiporter NhaC family protein, partial [Proteobacteria bacterium]|nr:Na+/H+ antiporter NhaC family protein [Pseudomonadota bacterium]